MKASQYFKTKAVNIVNQQWQGDTVTVTIFKHGWKKSYRFKAKNLYAKNEQILEDEDIVES